MINDITSIIDITEITKLFIVALLNYVSFDKIFHGIKRAQRFSNKYREISLSIGIFALFLAIFFSSIIVTIEFTVIQNRYDVWNEVNSSLIYSYMILPPIVFLTIFILTEKYKNRILMVIKKIIMSLYLQFSVAGTFIVALYYFNITNQSYSIVQAIIFGIISIALLVTYSFYLYVCVSDEVVSYNYVVETIDGNIHRCTEIYDFKKYLSLNSKSLDGSMDIFMELERENIGRISIKRCKKSFWKS